MVVAVVDDGTFQIDRYVENTVDYAKVGEHYYSDKPPGAAFLGIPVYAALKAVLDLPVMNALMETLASNEALEATLRESGSGLLEQKVRFAIAQTALAFVASSLPTAVIGILMFRLLARFTDQLSPRIVVVIGYGLLTPVFAYAGAFYGHQLSAACLFVVFYLVFTGDRPLPTRSLLAVGFLLGYSVITEYPSVLPAGILFVYTLFRETRRRRIGWVILTGLIVAAGFMAYNTTVFGSPFALGYSYSELWVEQHHTGFMSLTLPSWDAIWGITFSPFRGLFLYSPFLLLSVPGFILWYRSSEHRAEFWVGLSSTLSMFLFNSSSIMWWGGFAVGPRYLLPMLTFMALPIVFVFRKTTGQAWIKIVVFLLAVWSLVAVWGLALADQAFPSDVLRNPLVEYALPNWRAGNIARNWGMLLHLPGILSLLPLFLCVAALLVILWIVSHQQRYQEATHTDNGYHTGD
jgi:hypothetical protein